MPGYGAAPGQAGPLTLNVTATFGTPLLFLSTTRTAGPVAAAMAFATAPLNTVLGVAGISCIAEALIPVAVKATRLPERPADAAVKLFGPAVLPRVQPPTVAIPLVLVVCDAPVRLPPPEPTANVTATPAIGFPKRSVTSTAGGLPTADPATAVCPLPAWTPITDAERGTARTANVTMLLLPERGPTREVSTTRACSVSNPARVPSVHRS